MQTLVSHIKVDGLLTQPLPQSFHLFLLALLHERFTCYVPGIDIGIGHKSCAGDLSNISVIVLP